MKIKRFSKTGERDDLKVGDKISLGAIKINNALSSKKDKELMKNLLKPDSTEEDYDKYKKAKLKKNVAFNSIPAIGLAGFGAYRRGLKGLKDGAIVGGVLGGASIGSQLLLDNEAADDIKKLKNHQELEDGRNLSKKYDLYRLADKEITKEDFIKKHYKDKEFSKKDDEGKRSKKDIAKSIAIAGAGGIGGLAVNELGKDIRDKAVDNLLTSDNIEGDKKLKERLISDAKKKGTTFIDSPHLRNSAAIGGGRYGRLINDIPKVSDLVKDANADALKGMGLSDKEADNVKKALLKDSVILGKGRLSGADVLAHELGHAHYQYRGGLKGFPIEAAHQLATPGQMATFQVGKLIGAGVGFKSGLKKAKLESVGEKESKFNKIQGLAPAIIATPMLVAEGAASRKGLQLLKNAGASEKALKSAKKNLTDAWKSYGSSVLASTGISEGSRGVGYGIGRLKYGKKKSNEDKKD